MNISIGNVNKQSLLSCLELILANVETKNIDYAFVTELYDDVSRNLNNLASTTESQLVLDSVSSLLEMLKVHEELLETIRCSENGMRKTMSERGAGSSGLDLIRSSMIDSMKINLKYNNGSGADHEGLNSVVGIEEAKEVLKEACIFPLHFPHLFTGVIKPWRRILIYGPPGTGKTLLARALAGEMQFDVYCVSTASLFSAWIGESEKVIRDLFEYSRAMNKDRKCMIFIDEVDSLCRERNSAEDEHSRRVKTELLRQMDGIMARDSECEPLILASTNCPWDIDPAFLRRFQKRIFIGLPNRNARKSLLQKYLTSERLNLSSFDWDKILELTEGYSGADLRHVVITTVMIPIREVHMNFSATNLSDNNCPTTQKRTITISDFEKAIKSTSRTVSANLLEKYKEFENSFL